MVSLFASLIESEKLEKQRAFFLILATLFSFAREQNHYTINSEQAAYA